MPCMSFLRNRTVIGVFCILLSVLICFGLTPLFNRAVSQKVEIVRVTQPIRAGEQITDDMVQLVQVGGYNLPDNVLHEKANAVGKYSGRPDLRGHVSAAEVLPGCSFAPHTKSPCPEPSESGIGPVGAGRGTAPGCDPSGQ